MDEQTVVTYRCSNNHNRISIQEQLGFRTSLLLLSPSHYSCNSAITTFCAETREQPASVTELAVRLITNVSVTCCSTNQILHSRGLVLVQEKQSNT